MFSLNKLYKKEIFFYILLKSYSLFMASETAYNILNCQKESGCV